MSKWFEYHCWESEESSDAELWHHTHQQVEVLHKLEDVDFEMSRVRFSDGLEYDVFDEELFDDPNGFYRPNYAPMAVEVKRS